MEASLERFYPGEYRAAREQLREVCAQRALAIQSHVHPAQRGVHGEELAIDVVRLGPVDAPGMVILSSGVHGVEGLFGSGCQLALLHDEDLLARLEMLGLALLVVHAVNPWGFSHGRRVNEDNIDLNRNFIDFRAPLPQNPAYAPLHPVLLPDEDPGSDASSMLGQFLARFPGLRDGPQRRQFMAAVADGQVSHPDGLFYRGQSPAWSNTVLRGIVREHGSSCAAIAWIDLHSGLGPFGHGEKVHLQGVAGSLAAARACWGSDVVAPVDGDSVANDVHGSAGSCLAVECAHATGLVIGLEFGTRPLPQVLQALRVDQWLVLHRDVPAARRAEIRATMRDAFYPDSAVWRGMVLAQTRVATLQAMSTLGAMVNGPGAAAGASAGERASPDRQRPPG